MPTVRPCVYGAPKLVAGRRRSSSCAACREFCRQQSASAWRPSCADRRDVARARKVSAAWLWHGSLVGAYRCGRGGVLRHAQKCPGGRDAFDQDRSRSHGTSRVHKPARRMARQRAVIEPRSRQYDERYSAHELQPAAPARQLLQDVGTHQPHKPRSRKLPQQAAQRVDAVACAEQRLDRAGDDATAIGEAARGCQSLLKRRHAALRLQHIAGRHQQPDLIEAQPASCKLDDMAMA